MPLYSIEPKDYPTHIEMLLSDSNLSAIVEAAFPGRAASLAELSLLRPKLTTAIWRFYNPFDAAELKELKKGLQAPSAKLIKELESYEASCSLLKTKWSSNPTAKDIQKRQLISWVDHGAKNVDGAIAEALSNLRSLVAIIRGFSLPKISKAELTTKDLPKVFEEVFQCECGMSEEGPGVRFIAAVLLATGIENNSVENLKASIFQARKRAARKAKAAAV